MAAHGGRPTLGFLTLASLCVAPALATAQTFDVTTTADTLDANPGDGVCADGSGACSLRAAVQEANALGGGVIRLAHGASYALTIAGAGEDLAATGDLDVSAPIAIAGNGATLDAQQLDRAFDVAGAGSSLFVRRLDVVNGRVVDASGGAYRSTSELELSGCSVASSAALGTGASGGALFNDGGRLLVRTSRLSGCSAERAGGAIEANGGTTTVELSHLTDNSTGPAPGNGGALHLTGAGEVRVRTSSLRGNSAAREGGGLWNSGTGSMTVVLSLIADNHALGSASDDGGGGLFNDGGTLHVDLCDVRGNTADVGSGSGGGIFNNGGVLDLARSRVRDNSARRAGGGIECLIGTTSLRDSILGDNATGPQPGNGGGLHLTGDGRVSVDGGRVHGNRAAAEGGGLWNSGTGTMQVSRCSVDGNTASGNDPDQGGGGLFNDGGMLSVTSTSLIGNVADGRAGSGGAILNHLGTLDVSRALIAFNAASRAGGGVEANAGTTNLQRVVISGNRAGDAPGNGGGVHLTGSGLVTLALGVVTFNEASAEGGGLWSSATGTTTVSSTFIHANAAPLGPQVFNDGGTFTIDGTPVP